MHSRRQHNTVDTTPESEGREPERIRMDGEAGVDAGRGKPQGEVLQRRLRFLACALSALVLSHCTWDRVKVEGDSQTRVRALYDSPVIQAKAEQAVRAEEQFIREMTSLSAAAALQRQEILRRHAETERNLINEMGLEPGYEVPGQIKFKILFGPDGVPYVKVEFESGPFRGRVGWLRRGSFDDPRTHFP